MPSFSEIPTLKLSEARDPASKPAFLTSLRDTLLNVGFLYLSDTGLPQSLIDDVIRECQAFFTDLSEEEKIKVEMKNEQSFLGYSRLGNEMTAGKADWREQMDLSTPHRLPGPDSPPWHHLWGPNQWPSSEALPKFRPAYEEYMQRMSDISMFFTSLIAESIGLESNAFDKFFDEDQQHKLKLVKYPDGGSGAGQGVGPHKDSMLSSYLLQASDHNGLQAQNTAGEWIDCPPIPGTLVVAIGQGMEAITSGVCSSTTHRVLSPEAGKGARYSIPFFQGVSFDAEFDNMGVPEEVKRLRPAGQRKDDVEFTFKVGKYASLGEATLMNRIKSHPDVGEKWYPERLAQIKSDQMEEARRKRGEVGEDREAPRMEPARTAVTAH